MAGRFGPDQSGVMYRQRLALRKLGNLDRVLVTHGRTINGSPDAQQRFQWADGYRFRVATTTRVTASNCGSARSRISWAGACRTKNCSKTYRLRTPLQAQGGGTGSSPASSHSEIVQWQVMEGTTVLILAGVALGVAVAPGFLQVSAIVMLVVAVAAAYLPTRSVSQIDPIEAIRAE